MTQLLWSDERIADVLIPVGCTDSASDAYDTGVALTKQMRNEMQAKIDELEALNNYLTFFHSNADFGPAHTDVVMAIQALYEKKRGAPVPADWKYE